MFQQLARFELIVYHFATPCANEHCEQPLTVSIGGLYQTLEIVISSYFHAVSLPSSRVHSSRMDVLQCNSAKDEVFIAGQPGESQNQELEGLLLISGV